MSTASSKYFLNRSLDSFCSCRVFALSFDEEVLLLELPDPAAAVHPDFSLLVTSSLAMTSTVTGSPALATLLVRASQRDGDGSRVASAVFAIFLSLALPLPRASSITDASSCLFLDGKPRDLGARAGWSATVPARRLCGATRCLMRRGALCCS